MKLTDRVNAAAKAAYNVLTDSRPVVPRTSGYSSVDTIENIKAVTLPPDLQQYAEYVIHPPAFYTYWTFYQIFNEVSTPVNRIATRVSGLSGGLYDDNGDINKELTDKFIKQYNIHAITEEFVIDNLVYGQSIVAEFEGDNVEDTQKFQLIPSHQVTLWQSKMFSIEKIRWHWEYRTLNIYGDDMYLSKRANLNSKFFGKSPFNSFYSDLDQMNLDRENFNEFLEHNSFFGVAVMPNDNLTQDQLDVLTNTVKVLNDKKQRYKAGVYQGVKKLEQIKQEIQNRLSTEEKKYIALKSSNAVGYPHQLLAETSGGLGQGEQRTIIQNFKEETINPLQAKVQQMMNNFILKRVDAEYEGLHWIPNQMQTTTVDEMMKVAIDGFNSGLISAYEAKTRFLGYEDGEAQDDDKFRKVGNQVVKEGELKEGDMESEDVQDELNENIKTTLSRQEVQKLIENKKNLNGNDKQRMKRFLQKVKKERDEGFSPGEVVITNDRAKMLGEMLEKAMIQQFRDFDYIMNKKDVEVDSNLTLEEIQEELTPLANYLDVSLLTYYISYLVNLGRIDGINQIEELGLVVTPEERGELNTEVNQWASDRVESLLGFENGIETELHTPILPSSLDDTTATLLFSILSMASTKKEVDELFMRRLKERIKLIQENESTTAYNAGVLEASKKKPQLMWEWLKTVSKNPRVCHLELVGRTAPVGQRIDGEYPGVRVNCKCGIKLLLP